MAKKSAIARNKKRIKLADKYSKKREALKLQMRSATGEERMRLQQLLSAMPKNSNPTRVRNRCALTGRPRGVYRKFNLSRNMLRELAMQGLIPGIVMSSW